MDLAALLNVLDLQPRGGDVFEGHSPADRQRAVFGGQFLAQALMAAGATADADRVPHSLHAYFLRAGDPATPIEYRVDRLRDGRSFSHRQAVASQGGREVFRLVASFQVPTNGPEYESRLPIAGEADPAGFTDYLEWLKASSNQPDHGWFAEGSPVEVRFENAPPLGERAPFTGEARLWVRLRERVPTDSPLVHAALLAWISDKTLADFTTLPHGHRWTDVGVESLSLDHAMWFLRYARADQWLLFTQDTPSTSAGRGLARGDLALPDGSRVAAVVQEALVVLP